MNGAKELRGAGATQSGRYGKWKSVSSRSNRLPARQRRQTRLRLRRQARPRPQPRALPPQRGPVEAQLIPERASQQYAQALQLMKSGRSTDAELEFKELAIAIRNWRTAIEPGLLYVRDSRLPEAEAAFKTALELKPIMRWRETSSDRRAKARQICRGRSGVPAYDSG